MIVFFNSPEEINFVKKNIPENMSFFIARWGRWGHGMIMRKDATKLVAIMEFAKFWNIDKVNIVSFGDDEVDIDVLAYAGIGVAMENAIPKVKAVADYICDTNDNDGLAKWLEEHIL